MILIFLTPLQPTVVLIPYSQYIGALVVIDWWPGQLRTVTSAVGTMVGEDGIEVTYDDYNNSDTEITYDEYKYNDKEEGLTEGR